MLTIRRIPFETIKDYWIEVGHFHVPNKKINEAIITLGPYKSTFTMENQPTKSYGLFKDGEMIGGTQIQQWNDTSVRWRTINIREEHRGGDLAYKLLATVIAEDWSDFDLMLGWFRSSVFWWPEKHAFAPYDGQIHDHDGDMYIMVRKNIKSVCAEVNNSHWSLKFE